MISIGHTCKWVKLNKYEEYTYTPPDREEYICFECGSRMWIYTTNQATGNKYEIVEWKEIIKTGGTE